MKNKTYLLFILFLITGTACLNGCKKNSETQVVSLPKVNTSSASEVTASSATIGGYMDSDGGSALTDCGVCWSTHSNPTLADNKISSGIRPGSFNSHLNGLYQGTTYYVRAYAVNSKGTAFGDVQSFTTGYLPYEYSYFPLAVWMQDPKKTAAQYKSNGINTFVALWNQFDETQWTALKNARMRIICAQNDYGLSLGNDTLLTGWIIQEDEPDNAQWNAATQKYDPCIDPLKIINEYNTIKQKDQSRPVFLGLGQGVAYNNYVGRGTCRNNIESYKVSNNGYLVACDIAAFDIYPVNNTDATSGGNLEYVAIGIQNLINWSGNKPCWNDIETTRISDTSPRKPTPSEVRSEVWMSIIHGAKGINYFCHSFVTGATDESALLHDPEMMAGVKKINDQITALASVLNSSTTSGYASVSSINASAPVVILTKNHGGANYIFASAMKKGQSTTATFSITSGTSVEVLGEGRSITVTNGKFADEFEPYAVHLYKIK